MSINTARRRLVRIDLPLIVLTVALCVFTCAIPAELVRGYSLGSAEEINLQVLDLADPESELVECNRHVRPQGVNATNVTFALINLWNFDDGENWTSRSDIIFQDLLRNDPQVIALNEVRTSRDQGSMFDDACKAFRRYRGYFQPAMEYGDGTIEGVAFFTRLPMTNITAKHLHLRKDSVEDPNKRVILGGYLPDLDFAVFVSHFSYQQDLRMLNAKAATWFIASFFTQRKLFLADFNAVLESDPAVVLLRRIFRFADAHEAREEPTYCNCGHEVCLLNERPDRILYTPRKPRHVQGWTGPKGVVGDNCPSDHRAVYLRLIGLNPHDDDDDNNDSAQRSPLVKME